MPELKLGKLPARTDAVKLKLATYLDTSVLPKPPASFGHENLVKSWGMLGNDVAGCCVWSGAGHETMLWNAESGKPVNITTTSTLKNYSLVTGYDPVTGANDNGTDMQKAAAYRQKSGLLDADGIRHKIGAYVALDPGNLTELWYGLYLFDGIGIGVEFPSQWMDAFNAGKAWGKVSRPKIEGGHYIAGVDKRAGKPGIVTWGRNIPLTPAGYQQFCDETIAYLSEEKLTSGKSLEGFDLDTLRRDLALITNRPVAHPLKDSEVREVGGVRIYGPSDDDGELGFGD